MSPAVLLVFQQLVSASTFWWLNTKTKTNKNNNNKQQIDITAHRDCYFSSASLRLIHSGCSFLQVVELQGLALMEVEKKMVTLTR